MSSNTPVSGGLEPRWEVSSSTGEAIGIKIDDHCFVVLVCDALDE